MTTLEQLQAQYNDKNALDALGTARSTLEAAIRELDRYAERLGDANSSFDKADIMNWALNHLACSIMPNLRLELIAKAQAEFLRAAQAEKSK
jgi:hypothetical protein